MRDKSANSGGHDKTVRYLSIAAIVLTILLVVVTILGARWWALEERRLAAQKIERLKKELEMCIKGKE